MIELLYIKDYNDKQQRNCNIHTKERKRQRISPSCVQKIDTEREENGDIPKYLHEIIKEIVGHRNSGTHNMLCAWF